MERVWLSRLRWRLRGALQWPIFAIGLVVDAALLHELPIAGDGADWAQALLLAGFFALVTVAVLAPLAGRLLRRRRADLPATVASDHAGAALLCALTLALVAAGVAHRPQRLADRNAVAAQSAAVHRYVMRFGEAQFRRNLGRATTIGFGDDLYRTCVPSDRPRRALCLLVDTSQSPPGVREDRNRAPNSTFGPTGPG